MRKLLFLLSACIQMFTAHAQESTMRNPPFSCLELPEASGRGFGRPFYYWESQIIPYRFGPGADAAMVNNFRQLCDTFMANTNLCFIPATNETDVLTIEKTDRSYAYFSYDKIIHVFPGCVACPHELGHALGLAHEHQRPDRDSFIHFYPENVDPQYLYAFEIIDDPEYSVTTEYDFASMMHYGAAAFSAAGEVTLTRKDGSLELGGIMPTALDYQKINALYPEKIDCKTIQAERPPAAVFTVKPLAALCEGSAVQTTNLTIGENLTFEWRIEGAEPSFSTVTSPVIAFPQPGGYFIYLKASNTFGSHEMRHFIQIDSCGIPLLFDYWNNPTSGRMTLFFYRASPSEIPVMIYNMAGQPVFKTTVEPGNTFPSIVEFEFPGNLPSGVYVLRLESGTLFQNIKVALLR